MNEASTQVIRPRAEIKITERQKRTFWKKVNVKSPDECWLWKLSKNTHGYGQVAIGIPSKPKAAHRVAWILRHGAIPDGMCICHTCDTPACCNPSHMFLGTQAENLADMTSKKRRALRNNAKLTPQRVLEIRAIHKSKLMMQKDMAKKYNVSATVISRVIAGALWAHV